jgi:protein-tyrosine-phosphatase
MPERGVVLFLCLHNAAKSVLAVAYFDQVARARDLPYRADSAGTEPEAAPSPAVVAALRREGIDVGEHQPRRLTVEDLTGAHRVVSMGCDVHESAPPGLRVERWDDVPPVSQDLDAAYAAIRRRVEALVADLEREDS